MKLHKILILFFLPLSCVLEGCGLKLPPKAEKECGPKYPAPYPKCE